MQLILWDIIGSFIYSNRVVVPLTVDGYILLIILQPIGQLVGYFVCVFL